MTDSTTDARLTVGEFIERLKALPQDIPILAEYEEWEGGELHTATATVETVAICTEFGHHRGELVRKKSPYLNDKTYFPAVVIVAAGL